MEIFFFSLLRLHFAAFLLCFTVPRQIAMTSQSFTFIRVKIFPLRLAELPTSVKFTWILIFVLEQTDRRNEATFSSYKTQRPLFQTEILWRKEVICSTFLSVVSVDFFKLSFTAVLFCISFQYTNTNDGYISVCTGSGKHAPLELLLVSISACFCLSSLCVINTHRETAKLRYVKTHARSLKLHTHTRTQQ